MPQRKRLKLQIRMDGLVGRAERAAQPGPVRTLPTLLWIVIDVDRQRLVPVLFHDLIPSAPDEGAVVSFINEPAHYPEDMYLRGEILEIGNKTWFCQATKGGFIYRR
jgi:hypothetical protein